ncbi:ubiquitin carboxyl-terminal hydrolase 47 isoform X4 [Trematomus bernacchii]|uniref:ubiquitin carboxyl-terminal hydrolase 47 isoform X4 n=1 Tax=Trematomus bernacchii TaxID=40690 RepID=UPI00146F7F04|nr:ubiquitin carboxyl-terminal hydrolase 47 isoform X4 [Trematomus bernacchii]
MFFNRMSRYIKKNNVSKHFHLKGIKYDVVEKFREKLDSFTDYHGLNSPGLTCYLNSILQVLYMTEDFREAVKQCRSKDSTTIDSQLGRLFSDLQKRLSRTHDVTKKLGITNVYEQRDAAEYFEKILCMTSPDAAQIFKGELNHITKCLKCKERNQSRSFFWVLPLAIEDLRGHIYSVEKGLKAFFKGEKCSGDDTMYCDRCNEKQDAVLKCEITTNPEILTLLLKRFSFDYKLRCYVKLQCNVDVPKSLFIGKCKYDLYALVNHFGNLTGGHYTAHIKSIETDTWYHFNDNIVNMVQPPLFGASNHSLRSCTAYLLMYKKGVDAEGRQDETERGELPVPHHQLNDGSCHGGGNLKLLNAPCVKPGTKDSGADGDCLQSHKSDFPTLQKSHENRQQLDRNSEQPMQLLHTRGKHSEHLGTHKINHVLEQSTKKRLEVNETVWGTQKTKGSLRNRVKHVEAEEHLCSSDVKSLPVSYSSSSLTNLKGHKPIKVCMQPSIKCNNSPKLCRKSNNSMKDGETMQHAVTADCTQTVSKGGKSPEDRGQSAKSRDRDKRAPWK